MNVPVFSIIIPCYNHGKFLSDCLNSITNQNFTGWEAILVNDGSTDDTEEIVKDLIKEESRIKYIYQENQGLSASRNTGMAAAKGEYLVFLDADDWLFPDCLKTYSNFLRENPESKLLRCGYAYWDHPKGRKYHTHYPVGDGLIYPTVLTQNIGPCHSVLIRRDFAESLGGFDNSLKSCEDWDFWICAGKMGARIDSISETLVAYRYVPHSMSRNPLVMYEALTEVSRRAGKSDERFPKDAPYNHAAELDYPSIQKKHLIRMLGVMLYQGKAWEAAEWYAKEKKVWMWEEEDTDWKGLSSYLSWGYFFDSDQIEKLITQTASGLAIFFKLLGYSPAKSQSLIKMIFEPQLKRKNHLNYGKLLGGVKNKLGWY